MRSVRTELKGYPSYASTEPPGVAVYVGQYELTILPPEVPKEKIDKFCQIVSDEFENFLRICRKYEAYQDVVMRRNRMYSMREKAIEITMEQAGIRYEDY